MKVCPRCGAARENATPLALPDDLPVEGAPLLPPVPQAAPPIPQLKFEPSPEAVERPAPRDAVYLSPPDVERRFPLFTSAQITLIVIGVTLLILAAVIAYLLWRQQVRDEQRFSAPVAVAAGPTPAGTPAGEPSPTPTPTEDQLLQEAVKAALMAYNPFGFTRYQFTVQNGIVTIDGDAEHQPEKEGAENVVKLVAGVKSVVNRLRVKSDPSLASVKVNEAEARLLQEALRQQLEMQEPPASAEPVKPAAPDPQKEEERLRRELAAARQRAEELAQRQAAEEKLRREAEEFNRRQEELRRTEAERRTRTEQARTEIAGLRSGTVAWSGMVDGKEDVIFSGSSASVRHLEGASPREVRASFSAPIPRAPVNVALISTIGRGPIQIVQKPAAENGYTTIVRVDDSQKSGEKRYEFTLRWSM